MRQWWQQPAVWVWVIWTAVYWMTGARTITGFGDSDELISAGYSLALPHQPGYPLLTGLVFLATHLPWSNPAVWAHRLAGLIEAGAVAMVVWGFSQITQGKKPVAALALGLIVGGSALVWKHGLFVEVFGLMGLFSLVLLVWAVWYPGHWWWWGVVAGLGLGHHQLLLLTIVPQAIWIVFQDKKRWQAMAKGGFVGLGATLIGIWLLGLRQHPDSWQIELTLPGVINYFLRSYYSGYSLEIGGTMAAYLSRVDVLSVWHSLKHYAWEMWRFWGVWNVVAVVGMITGRTIHKSFWLIVACFIMSGPVLAGYMAVDEGNLVERMYLLSQWYWGLLIGFGLVWSNRQWPWLVVAIAYVVLVLPVRSLSHYVAQAQYVENLFAGLPQGAGLICLSDQSCFGSYYYQRVLKQRLDVVVIPNAEQLWVGRRSAWVYGGFNYPDNPFRLGEAIGRATLMGRPIYVAQLNAVWTRELGLDGQAFVVQPDRVRHRIERPAAVVSVDCGADPLCQLRQLSFAVWRDPEAIEPRLALAAGFSRYGLASLAEREMAIVTSLSEKSFQFLDQNPK